jgi:hypothetical protein
MIPFYKMSNEQLGSFCRSYDEIWDRIRSGEKMNRTKIKEICTRNRVASAGPAKEGA